MDETNPHMHLMYLPVVHKVDKKSGKVIHKLCCNDFWKMGQYIKLIKDFNNYMQEKGFDVERRITGPENEEIRLRYYKMVTGFELYKYNKMRLKKEEVKDTDDINFLKEEYKRLVKKCNIFADEYINIKAIVDSNAENFEKISKENETIKKENRRLNRIIDYLKKHIRKSYECVSLLFDIPAASIKSIVRRFVDSEERDNNSQEGNNGLNDIQRRRPGDSQARADDPEGDARLLQGARKRRHRPDQSHHRCLRGGAYHSGKRSGHQARSVIRNHKKHTGRFERAVSEAA